MSSAAVVITEVIMPNVHGQIQGKEFAPFNSKMKEFASSGANF